jgi:hypothetical protein
MIFVHGWFLSPGSSRPTQSCIANDSPPKMEFNKSFNGAIGLWLNHVPKKTRGNNKSSAPLLKLESLCDFG